MVPELPDDPTDDKSQWVRQASADSIYIMGSVGAPGRYAFNRQMHFLDIVTAADGPNISADLRNIRVTHRGERGSRVSKVNLALYFETGDETILPRVKNGDVIYIPDQDREWLDLSKEKSVRVLGAVKAPGRYEFDDSMTILDLLAEAGGPASDALIEKIRKRLGPQHADEALLALRSDNVARAIEMPGSELCQACITGNYPTERGQELYHIDLTEAGKPDRIRRAYERTRVATASNV